MAVNHLLLLLLVLLAFKTGISAENYFYAKTGDSVQLDIQTQKLPKIEVLYWENDKSTKIVTYIQAIQEVIYDSSYKDRVDFNDKTFSLTLKNIQKTDSGLYEVKTNGVSETAYRVTVIDAVEAPILTVNSNWSSSDSCTVNFTCRAQDLMIHSSYQNNRCSPEEVTSQLNTLTLNCSEESIICNHSNPVSWDKDRINIKQLCVKQKENDPGDNPTKPLPIWLILGLSFFFLAIVIFILVLYCKYKKGAQEVDSTKYAQVEGQEMLKTNSDSHTYDVPERAQDQTQQETGDNRPETTYCTVGQHLKPAVSVETGCTIYSTVCKQPTKKPPTISSDDR